MTLIKKLTKDMKKIFLEGTSLAVLALSGCGGASTPADNGFGEDEPSARAYIEQVLEDDGYSYEEDVNAEFLNPNTSEYFSNNYDIRGFLSLDEIYIEYNSTADGLTPKAEDGINARTNANYPPPLVIINPKDTKAEIKNKINSALGIVGASAGQYKQVRQELVF